MYPYNTMSVMATGSRHLFFSPWSRESQGFTFKWTICSLSS